MPDPTAKPGILRNLRIKRVALVDNGANLDRSTGDGSHIMLFKRDTPTDTMDPADGDIDEYEHGIAKGTLDAAARHALPDSAFAAVWVDEAGKKHRKLPIHDAGHLAAARGRIAVANIPAHVKAEAERRIEAASRHHQSEANKPTDKEKSVKKNLWKSIVGLFTETDPTKRAEALATLEKEFPPDEDDDKPVHKSDDPMCKCADCVSMRASKLDKAAKDGDIDAKIAKAVTSAVTEMNKKVEAAEARATAAETIAKAQQSAFDRAEMSMVLKGFRATPFDMEKDVDKFLTLKRVAPVEYERTMAILKATDSQLAASALYRNVGVSGSSAGTAWDQIEAKADAMMEKSANSSMTREQAIEKVCLANPKLAAQYRSEMQGVAVQ